MGEWDGDMRCLLGTGQGDGDQGEVPTGDWDEVAARDGDMEMGPGRKHLMGTGMG